MLTVVSNQNTSICVLIICLFVLSLLSDGMLMKSQTDRRFEIFVDIMEIILHQIIVHQTLLHHTLLENKFFYSTMLAFIACVL